jgi:thiol-disulfide isomerase/thioredoxin
MKTHLAGPILLAITLAAALSVRAAQLGDAAAPLEIAEWVKGDPVDLAAAKGKKVVVVEFWATWCGPCRVSIPHLTEMQKKFESRGVLVVGVSDEDLPKVKSFVNEQGDKMNYTVAIDRNNATSDGYMKRYGQNGIPHAFVVDKDGRVAWHGHPMAGLDRVLDQLAANTFDLGLERQRQSAAEKIEEYFQRALKGEDDEKLDKLGAQISALDRELGGINPGEKLDLGELKRTARFQNLMSDYQRAIAGGKSDAELAKIEAKAVPLAPKDFKFDDFKARYQLQRTFSAYYRSVTGKGGATQSEDLAKKLEAASSDNAEMLNDIAWTLLTDEKIKQRNLKLATKFARAAVEASHGQDAGILDTYARALFDTGNVDEAVRQQRKAIELCDEKERKAELQETLKRYEGKLSGK